MGWWRTAGSGAVKIKIEVDCTPDEARAFLGLPDVSGLQERMLGQLEERMVETLRQTDPQVLMDRWMPFGAKGMEQWQALWTQMLHTASNLTTKDRPKDS